MNDINLKIEEPKSPREVAGSPSTLTGTEDVLDPLAIDEDGAAVKDLLVVKKPGEERVGTCDDDAKEKISETQNGVVDEVKEEIRLETEICKEDVKEPSPVEIATEEPVEKNEPEIDQPMEVEISVVSLPTVKEEHKPQSPVSIPTPITEEKVIEKEPSSTKEVEENKEVVDKIEVEVKKEVVQEADISPEEPDQEMTEVAKVEEKIEPKIEQRSEPKSKTPPMNGEIPKHAREDQGTKRRSSEEVETDSPLKKLCQGVEKSFPQHDSMINDYIQAATRNNIDEVQRLTEELLSEIQILREQAQKKEHEWNSILHLKKVKEEILLRLLRRKQVLSYEKPTEINGQDPFEYLNNQAKNLAIDKSDEISGLAIKQPGATLNPMMQPPVMPMSPYNPMAGLPPPYDKAHLQNMPKPVFPQQLMLPGPLQGFPRDMNGQMPNYALPMGRQGPTKDVKSIIADYRQRNPDITPRRGRRMKSILHPNILNNPRAIAPKMDSMNNLANMGMGNMNNMASMNNMANMSNMASMNNMANMSNMANMNNMGNMNNMANNMANIQNLNNMIFNNLDMNQKAMLERLQQVQGGSMPNGMSFKDVLVQYANMQQNNPALIPNRVENIPIRPEQHVRSDRRRNERPERSHEEQHKPAERLASPNPRLPPPPYPEISLLPVNQEPSQAQQQNSLLHGILTKQTSPAPQSYSPTLAKLLTSPERKGTSLPAYGQAKNCGEITITPVQPPPPPEPQAEKTEDVVQLDDDESPGSEGETVGSPAGRLVIDEGGDAAETDADKEDTPLCQGCKKKDAQFVCAGCANQWYCSRDCQVAAWDDHSDMCSG